LIALALYLAFYYRLLGVVTWFGMAIWAILPSPGVGPGRFDRVRAHPGRRGRPHCISSLGITADSYIVFTND
jgi:hypothetical protein